ncbi:hypothetical protein [Dactylosporangium sp. NPDC048998]|uniref:hypothetical protein n=1 Tax=Dactylosporangium sp. NPDC048998 TaxID=3363976 RepID=UPI003717BE8C
MSADRRGWAAETDVWRRPAAELAGLVSTLRIRAGKSGAPDRAASVFALSEIARRNSHHQDLRLDLALRASVTSLAALIADPDPVLRRVVPHAIHAIGTDDPALTAAIAARATVEHDHLALAGQLRTVDGLATSTPAAWFSTWLHHPGPEVRLAAVAAIARRQPTPAQADGLGAIAGGAVAMAPPYPWHGSPWEFLWQDWTTACLIEHPHQAAHMALTALAAADQQARWTGLTIAAAVLTTWRLPMHELWAATAHALTDTMLEVRRDAATLLAVGGEHARPHADALADAMAADNLTVAAHAAAGLARLGDRRALPALQRWLTPGSRWPHTIPPRDVLAPMREHAAALLAPIRATLPAAPDHAGGCASALAAWGPLAAEAVPELTGLLDTGHATPACIALGRIGPAALPAADALRRLALGERRPRRFHGTQDAAWAHWQVTGDPTLALTIIGRAVERGLGQAMLPYLADLGPLAAGHAPAVRRLLHLPGGWSRAEAAHAWWRLTGDPSLALPVLLAAARPLLDGRSNTLVRTAARHLGTLGPAAAPALPLLQRAIDHTERPTDAVRLGTVAYRIAIIPHRLNMIPEDHELLHQAATALLRIQPR